MAKGIDPASGVSAYRQIADRLRSRITAGELRPGDRLPSEAELMEAYSAARATVRQAVGLLRSEGLVLAEQAAARSCGIGRRCGGWRTTGSRGGTAKRERPPTWSRWKAAGLRWRCSASARPRRRWRSRSGSVSSRAGGAAHRRYLDAGQPMEVATSFIPWDLAEGSAMVEENPGPGGIYARIEERGHELGRFTEDVTARMPTADEARALQLPFGTPVLHLVRTAYDTGDRPVEVCETVMAADRYVLNYELPAH